LAAIGIDLDSIQGYGRNSSKLYRLLWRSLMTTAQVRTLPKITPRLDPRLAPPLAPQITSIPEATKPAAIPTPTASTNGSAPILVDISERIRMQKFSSDETILKPPKQIRKKGPSYLGVVRMAATKKYFAAGVWKFLDGAAQLRLCERTREGPVEGGSRAICWLAQQPVENGSAHYRSGSFLENALYWIGVSVRTDGPKKVLEIKFAPIAVGEKAPFSSTF
jgi:hypothetical protein